MKIFAKRTRTVVDPETAEKLRKEKAAQKERDADKAVEELLKLDPSTLNSKQRRLVKRYKERIINPNEPQLDEERNEVSTEASRPDQEESKSASIETGKPVEQAEDDAGSSSGSSESDSISDSDDDAMDVPGNDTVEAKDKDESANAPAKDNGGLDDDTVKKLLEKVNSKQRRKLMRRLEREGSNVLNEIHEEALNLLKESEKSVPSEMTLESKPQQEKEQTVSGKKRKKDWGDLTPEERLRREEQRRMQQEAAARRAKDPNAAKRHPLNSERRRANRRKPKWERKRPVENEHNLSGYHMRRLKQADEV